jgi:hypothetical protein
MRGFLNRAALGAAALSASVLANATGTGPDFTSLTSSVDFSTVITAVLAIGAVIMLPKVAVWGTRKVLAMVKG